MRQQTEGETAVSGRSLDAASSLEVPGRSLFEAFPYGLAIVRSDGELAKLNRRARSILLANAAAPPERWTCCELICNQAGRLLGTACLTRLARAGSGDLPEVRIDVGGGHLSTAAWVTASYMDAEDLVLFHLRPGRPGDRRRRTRQGWHGDSSGGTRAELRITTLGAFSVESAEGPLVDEWVSRRPGELLKLLVARRRRLVCPDQIAEALWPDAGQAEAKNRLRYQVHALRTNLDPARSPRSESAFIRSRQGGYLLDTSLIWVDADEFEREARAGLVALEREDLAAARPHLARAGSLYKGMFMAEDPYAEWAFEERERLHELAVVVLRSRAEALSTGDELEAATRSAKRLAEIEPHDDEVQSLLLRLLFKQGRRGEAVRRFESYRRRMQNGFRLLTRLRSADAGKRSLLKLYRALSCGVAQWCRGFH